MTTTLEVKSLSFGYNHSLFHDFNLTLYQGEALAILGESGKGKSTLLDIIAGFLSPQKGEIIVSRIGYIFQDPFNSFHPFIPIEKQIRDVTPDFETKESYRVDLTPELLTRKPHQLSGGQLQRASILRAICMKPNIILADEPTSALDNVLALEIGKLLVSTLENSSLLLVTHDEGFAQWIANRIIKL